MLTKAQIKGITSLKQKKFRQLHGLFVAEGKKTVNELLNSNYELDQLYSCTADFDNHPDVKRITERQLNQISFLRTTNSVLAVFKIPRKTSPNLDGLVIALDAIRDPGNLGTIIRLCDWFGVSQIICSKETVDCYNPKVVQATMGSLARVHLIYEDLQEILKKYKGITYGTFMDGENIYTSDLTTKGIIVLGNEANGISAEMEEVLQKRISIPRFGKLQETESLNVANACGIILSEFKRRTIET